MATAEYAGAGSVARLVEYWALRGLSPHGGQCCCSPPGIAGAGAAGWDVLVAEGRVWASCRPCQSALGLAYTALGELGLKPRLSSLVYKYHQ